jgi:competence protein ComEC
MWHLIFLGYVFGIAIGLYMNAPFLTGVFFVFGASVIAVWQRFRLAWGIALIAVLIGIGYIQAHAVRVLWDAPLIEHSVSGQAIIVRSPEIKERTQEATLQLRDCLDGVCPTSLVMGYFSMYDTLHYGDILTIECPLKIPKNEGLDFDYRMYLAMKGVGYTCYPKTWRKESEVGGNGFVRTVLRVRSALEEKLDASVAYPESGLSKGLLFGGNSYLTKETQATFSRTGMSHIIAVSGANVVIVIECLFLLSILCGLWRRQALWVASIGIVLFVIMTGAGASAVRAGLMGGLVLLASYSGRVSDGLRLWTLALALMLCFNPLLLRYDLGFQLSFMATLGILLCMPLFESSVARKQTGIQGTLREIFWMTLSAEAFVLPIIVYNFKAFPLLSLVANILVLPVIPVAMLFGFLASLFGFVFAPLAKIFGLIAYLVLHYMMRVIEILGGQSFASVSTRAFGFWAICLWYGALFGGIVYLKMKVLRTRKDDTID